MNVLERYILEILAEQEYGRCIDAKEIRALLEDRLALISNKSFQKAMRKLRSKELVRWKELSYCRNDYYLDDSQSEKVLSAKFQRELRKLLD